MSRRRVVNLGDLNLDILEESCRKNGKSTKRNTKVDMYYGSENDNCDLVIENRIGFRRTDDRTVEAIYDDMYTSEYSDIIADYIEESTETYGNYHVVSKNDTKDFVTVSIAR